MLLTLVAGGCHSAQPPYGYRTAAAVAHRSVDDASAANERGVSLAAEGSYEDAEAAFRLALAADVTYAPAHNNLGLVLLHHGRLYESAREFSFAAKLDRSAPEPLINLGRLYESVGWYEAAIAEYDKALLRDGNSAEALGRLAHAYVRVGRAYEVIEPLLRALARRGAEGAWRAWAMAELAACPRPASELGLAGRAEPVTEAEERSD